MCFQDIVIHRAKRPLLHNVSLTNTPQLLLPADPYRCCVHFPVLSGFNVIISFGPNAPGTRRDLVTDNTNSRTATLEAWGQAVTQAIWLSVGTGSSDYTFRSLVLPATYTEIVSASLLVSGE